MPGKTLRLYPPPSTELTESAEIYKDLALPGSGRGGMQRPYVFINMVSSVDGNASIEGKASGIGASADRRVMRTLRSRADAVMIGAGTIRAEKLSLGLDTGDAGPSPLAVILATTGDVPLDNLLRYKDQELVVLLADSAGDAAFASLGSHAEVLRVRTGSSGRVDLTSAIERLKTERGVDRLLVEGGPTVTHAMISGHLVDELFVTLAPTLLGTSAAPTVVGGDLEEPQDLHLLSAYLADGEIFLRYALR